MASTKTQIKAIRIANETAEYFDGKPLNRYVESLHRLAEIGKITLDEEEIKLSGVNTVYTKSESVDTKKESVNTKKESVNTNSVNTQIEEMATLCGMTLDEFMGQIYCLLEEGKLLLDGNKIVVGK